MTQEVNFDLFFVGLVVLLLVLILLLVVCWILKNSGSRNLTQLQISGGQPVRVLTIKTGQEHTRKLLDHLLDRVFLQVEPQPESREEPGEESDSAPAASTFPPTVNRLLDKPRKWVTFVLPRPATPPPSSSSSSDSSSANQDKTTDPCARPDDISQHASCASQAASCSTKEAE